MIKIKDEQIFSHQEYTIHFAKEDFLVAEMLMNSLEENKKRIMAFFELHKLSEPKQIYVAPNRLDYQKHMEELCEGQPGWHYQDWMVADTIDGDINILNLECYRATVAHKNMDIEAYKKVVVHEFVHSCQQQINNKAYGVGWYWDGIGRL